MTTAIAMPSSSEELNFDRLVAKTKVDPRPYQRAIVAKGLQMFTGKYRDGAGRPQIAARSVLVNSPTGSGKTVMGLLTAKMLQDEFGCSVGWAAMRRNLLAQVQRENIAKAIGLKFDTISIFDKHPPKRDVLVVDEAQHDASNSCAHIHNEMQPDYIIGLSATPYRTDSVKLCFDYVIRDAGIHELIQGGYLSQYHHYTIPKWGPDEIAEFYLMDQDRWGKSVVFFHKVDECLRFKQLLADGGTLCEVVTGDSDRDEQLLAFEQGRVRILANCMVLTEGFDSPDLQTVFTRPSMRGPTIQMCGRVFRKFPGLRYKQVVQCKQTRHPFPKTALPAQSFTWESGEWRSLTVNPLLNQINRVSQLAIAEIDVKLPEFLTKKQKKRSW